MFDGEAYVAVAAMEAVSSLCRTAGDFLGKRVATEWSSILKLAKKVRMEAEKEKRGKFGEAVRKWEACIGLLCAIVQDVGVEEVVFGDVIDVLGKEVWERSSVREALGGERGNKEWVWLVCYLTGRERVRERPRAVEGREFVALDVEGVA